MRIVCTRKHSTYKSPKTGNDIGLFEISKDFLYCNAIHGSKSGTLWIAPQQGVMFEVKYTGWLRTQILAMFNKNDHGEWILINPCFPESIIEHYGKELAAQKIKVLTYERNGISRTWQEDGTLIFNVEVGVRRRGEVIRTITKPSDVIEYIGEL